MDGVDWTLYPLPLNIPPQPTVGDSSCNSNDGPTIYRGNLAISGTPNDTYITLCGWTKGQVWVNGYGVAKYWETAGPQHAFFVPGGLLQSGANDIVVLELHAPNDAATVVFTDAADFTTGPACAPATTPEEAALRINSSPRRAAVAAEDARALAVANSRIVESRAGAPRAPAVAPANPAPVTARKLLAHGEPVAACVAPTAGLSLTLQPCASAGPAATTWAWKGMKSGSNAGQLSLQSSPNLCMGVKGTNPDTGAPNIALVQCAAAPTSDLSQAWMMFAAPSFHDTLLNLDTSDVLDVPNSDASAGARLELWAANGGNANQKFTVSGTSGPVTISSGLNQFCVAAC